MIKSENQAFIEGIEYLKKSEGVSFKVISEKVGIDYKKVSDIRRGKSSADSELLDKLLKAYPFLEDILIPSQPDNRRLDEIEKENKELQKRIDELEKLFYGHIAKQLKDS